MERLFTWLSTTLYLLHFQLAASPMFRLRGLATVMRVRTCLAFLRGVMHKESHLFSPHLVDSALGSCTMGCSNDLTAL